MAQILRPTSTITDQGSFTGPSAHGSVDGTAPDTSDYWNGNDNQTDVLEVKVGTPGATPASGTCTVRIYETYSDTNVAPANAGNANTTFDLEVYEATTQRAVVTAVTPTASAFTEYTTLTFQASTITDWTDLRVRLTSTGGGGAGGGRRGVAVSYIEISVPDGLLTASGTPDVTGPTASGFASSTAFGNLRQSAEATGTTVTAAAGVTVTFPSTPESGNLIVLCAAIHDSAPDFSTTPTGYTKNTGSQPTSQGGTCVIYHRTSDGTETSVTVKPDETATSMTVHFLELYGPFDDTPPHLANSVDNIDSSTISTGGVTTVDGCVAVSTHHNNESIAENGGNSLVVRGGTSPGASYSLLSGPKTPAGLITHLVTWDSAPGAGWSGFVAFKPPQQVSASGTPNVTGPTSVGAAKLQPKGIGNASLSSPTSSGVAGIIKKATAVATVAVMTATGAAGLQQQILTANGSATAAEATSSGAAAIIKEANGSASTTAATASGSAQLPLKASGSASTDEATASGGAEKQPTVWLNTTATLSGATKMPVTAYSGTSITFNDPVGAPTGSIWLGVENPNTRDTDWIAVTVNVSNNRTASGTPNLSGPTATGVAAQSYSASGTPSLDAPTSSGAAGLGAEQANGSATVAETTATGIAAQSYSASGSPSSVAATSSGVASIGPKEANGSASVAEATSSGQIAFRKAASGSADLAEATSSGAVSQKYFVSGSADLTQFTAGGIAALGERDASGNATTDEVTASGQVDLAYGVSGSATQESPTASGTAIQKVVGSGTPTVESPTASAIVGLLYSVIGAADLQQATSSGQAGLAARQVTGNATLDELSASGGASTGTTRTANGTPQLDVTTASATTSQILKPSGSAALDSPTASGSAQTIGDLLANGDATLLGPTASGVAAFRRVATGSATLDASTSSGTVESTGVRGADGDAQLAEVTSSGVATGPAISSGGGGGGGSPVRRAKSSATRLLAGVKLRSQPFKSKEIEEIVEEVIEEVIEQTEELEAQVEDVKVPGQKIAETANERLLKTDQQLIRNIRKTEKVSRQVAEVQLKSRINELVRKRRQFFIDENADIEAIISILLLIDSEVI